MRKIIILCIMLFCFFAISCTEQQRAKQYGGSTKITIPPGKKLIIATWKGDNLWFLYRDRKDNEQPEIYEFRESSSWGVFQGVIKVIER